MKYLLSLLLLSGVVSTLTAQHVEKIVQETNNTKEIYYVLPGSDSIKQGSYEQYNNNKLAFSGWYKMGKKDSTWQHLHRGTVVAKRFYNNGERTGVWEFYNLKGEPDWSYDFEKSQPSYSESYHPTKPATYKEYYYLDDNGLPLEDTLDKKPLGLYSQGDWLAFLVMNLQYPQEAIDREQMGTVLVGVIINEKGEETGVELQKTATPALDQEALRIVSAFPFEFIPGEKNNRKVRSKLVIPITFRLENN